MPSPLGSGSEAAALTLASDMKNVVARLPEYGGNFDHTTQEEEAALTREQTSSKRLEKGHQTSESIDGKF